MTVLDASAILAFVLGEPGSEIVEGALDAGASCASVNWSEVAQKVRAAGRDWGLVRGLLTSYSISVVAVVADDAERAAVLWHRGNGLSLADRICLAVTERLDVEVLTADTTWGTGDRIRQIR